MELGSPLITDVLSWVHPCKEIITRVRGKKLKRVPILGWMVKYLQNLKKKNDEICDEFDMHRASMGEE